MVLGDIKSCFVDNATVATPLFKAPVLKSQWLKSKPYTVDLRHPSVRSFLSAVQASHDDNLVQAFLIACRSESITDMVEHREASRIDHWRFSINWKPFVDFL